jgi:hypothetical protein
MKTITLTIGMLIASASIFAQNNKLDDIFNKFQGKDGITSVLISSDLIKFASEMGANDSNDMGALKNITQVRILAFDNAIAQDIVSFDNMIKELSLNDYKELMIVKENKENIRMLAKEGQGRWSDFLLIVTGDKDHALINVQGSLSPKELHGLSKSMNVKGMAFVNKIK